VFFSRIKFFSASPAFCREDFPLELGGNAYFRPKTQISAKMKHPRDENTIFSAWEGWRRRRRRRGGGRGLAPFHDSDISRAQRPSGERKFLKHFAGRRRSCARVCSTIPHTPLARAIIARARVSLTRVLDRLALRALCRNASRNR